MTRRPLEPHLPFPFASARRSSVSRSPALAASRRVSHPFSLSLSLFDYKRQEAAGSSITRDTSRRQIDGLCRTSADPPGINELANDANPLISRPSRPSRPLFPPFPRLFVSSRTDGPRSHGNGFPCSGIERVVAGFSFRTGTANAADYRTVLARAADNGNIRAPRRSLSTADTDNRARRRGRRPAPWPRN